MLCTLAVVARVIWIKIENTKTEFFLLFSGKTKNLVCQAISSASFVSIEIAICLVFGPTKQEYQSHWWFEVHFSWTNRNPRCCNNCPRNSCQRTLLSKGHLYKVARRLLFKVQFWQPKGCSHYSSHYSSDKSPWMTFPLNICVSGQTAFLDNCPLDDCWYTGIRSWTQNFLVGYHVRRLYNIMLPPCLILTSDCSGWNL